MELYRAPERRGAQPYREELFGKRVVMKGGGGGEGGASRICAPTAGGERALSCPRVPAALLQWQPPASLAARSPSGHELQVSPLVAPLPLEGSRQGARRRRPVAVRGGGHGGAILAVSPSIEGIVVLLASTPAPQTHSSLSQRKWRREVEQWVGAHLCSHAHPHSLQNRSRHPAPPPPQPPLLPQVNSTHSPPSARITVWQDVKRGGRSAVAGNEKREGSSRTHHETTFPCWCGWGANNIGRRIHWYSQDFPSWNARRPRQRDQSQAALRPLEITLMLPLCARPAFPPLLPKMLPQVLPFPSHFGVHLRALMWSSPVGDKPSRGGCYARPREHSWRPAVPCVWRPSWPPMPYLCVWAPAAVATLGPKGATLPVIHYATDTASEADRGGTTDGTGGDTFVYPVPPHLLLTFFFRGERPWCRAQGCSPVPNCGASTTVTPPLPPPPLAAPPRAPSPQPILAVAAARGSVPRAPACCSLRCLPRGCPRVQGLAKPPSSSPRGAGRALHVWSGHHGLVESLAAAELWGVGRRAVTDGKGEGGDGGGGRGCLPSCRRRRRQWRWIDGGLCLRPQISTGGGKKHPEIVEGGGWSAGRRLLPRRVRPAARGMGGW